MSEEKESDLSPEQREEYDSMEKWMDEHPEFVHDYFARKAKRSMVDGWLIAHAIGLTHSHSDTNSSGSNSKPGSGANTPVRKISAQEFEKGGILKPMVSNVDGNLTFLGPSNLSSQVKTNRKSRSELKALDERELMYELVIDICNDLDVTSLCHKILLNVCILVNADRCSLFLVQGKGTEEKHLVSKLFDIHSESTFEETVKNTQEIRIPWGTGIIGYVAKTGEGVNIPDAYEDPRFNDEIDTKTGYKTRSIISMPIKDSEGDVIGVAQAVNKISPQDEPFDEHDEKVFASYLAFCGIGLKNAQLYERSLLENKRNQVLLDLARVIFEEQSDVANLIHKIMMHTQSLLQCERCQVLLVDDQHKQFSCKDIIRRPEGIFSQVFDLQASDFDNDDTYHREGNTEPRFPINIGITGYVATTGEPLNIPDAYKDDRFDPAVDELQGNFRTHSILCMPIKNACGQVIGVSQLVNKLDQTPFNKNDENLFEAFAIFCGLGISNTQTYEKAVRAMAKQSVALEVLSYHAIAPAEQAQRIKNLGIPSSKFFNLLDYGFNDFGLDDDDTIRACIRMFLDLDLLERFHINYEVLCRWLLSVKKNYRNVTYHNWRHAFNVAQTMFCMIKCGGLENMLTDQETLALMVGCLCHDLDHRGTTNQFMIKTASPLAQLYSTSTMEHHHFDQCIMILSTKGNDILGSVNQEEYERIIQLLEGAILATDLALYFRYRGEFFELVQTEKADWNCDDHKDLLRSMMMTACDVSAITKPWGIQQKVAQLIATEFFEQGDIEKAELKIKPQDMMDRDKQDQFPSMQVGFIDTICMPVYSAIAKVNPRLEPLLSGCKDNRVHWQELLEQHNRKMANEVMCENKDKDRRSLVPVHSGSGSRFEKGSRSTHHQSELSVSKSKS
ncbi:dual 3',5'-cyclic-AMP and -GMP phosphodiesterase 11-like isoform X2 [Liolophura sinensis]|uniref:dual 3',5'-cyclic-AMP and -GMP phosphodiesterase 11-like isoform X2 n=1 Tax=Liolophura sinensis TaxID=3198878 RepID=UPI00315819D2